MSKKPPWLFNQSGVIPYRFRDGAAEVLLITSKNGRRWILPKGVIAKGMTARASAANEAWEEAGVLGIASQIPIGSYDYKKWGGTCSVQVFLLQVKNELKDWPEASKRQRCWVSVSEAMASVEDKNLAQLIAVAQPDLAASSESLS